MQRAVVEVHVASDGTESLTHIGLDFGDGKLVTLGCGSDGQSLQVANEVLRDYEMKECGRMEIREFALAPGSLIDEAVPMVDSDLITFGVLLRTRARNLFVFNWGDDLYAEDALPTHVRDACVNALPL